MKITTWITPEPVEVDVNVSLEDIRNALEESPESTSEAFMIIKRCSVCLKSISPEIIDEMNDAQRRIVFDFLTEQAARYGTT